jgi:chemotaxis protein MotB
MLSYHKIAQVTVASGAMLLGVVGCGGREKVAMANKDATIRKQEEMLERERQDKEQALKTNEELARQNAELAERQSKLAAENAAQTAAMRQEMADMQALLKGLGDKYAASKSGEVPVDKDGGVIMRADGSISIIVANTTLFDSGKAELKTSSHTMLQKVASTIKAKYPRNYIRIEGHTDSTPVVHNKNSFADNMALSIARSRAVYDYMIKGGGLSASKMYTAGYGEHQPMVKPERTAADRAKNRRVEIVIMPENVKVTKEPMAAASKK